MYVYPTALRVWDKKKNPWEIQIGPAAPARQADFKRMACFRKNSILKPGWLTGEGYI